MTWSKRLFDLAVAAVIALVLVPVCMLLVPVLLVSSGRPLLYGAERMRSPVRAFRLWKFRTMRPDPNDHGVSGGDKNARVTRAGRFLRRTRMDEIPQLWNVFAGDISFVGPRPPLRQYVESFPELYGEVLKSRPGITGLATLRFHGREEQLLRRCATPAETDRVYRRRCVPRKARLDLIYQANRSLCLDVYLLAQTAGQMLAGLVARRKGR